MLEILGIDSVEFLFQNLRTFLFFFLLNFFNYFISLFTFWFLLLKLIFGFIEIGIQTLEHPSISLSCFLFHFLDCLVLLFLTSQTIGTAKAAVFMKRMVIDAFLWIDFNNFSGLSFQLDALFILCFAFRLSL